MPTTVASLSVDLNCTLITPNSSSTAAYDAEGAMKFSVAVVLVFGVGVIGLLGIYHRRNSQKDLSDKEADEFVKGFERKRSHMEKRYRKELMRQVVESFFARTVRVQKHSSHQHRDVRSSLRPTLSEPSLLLQTVSPLADHHPKPDSTAQAHEKQQTKHEQPTDHHPAELLVAEGRSRSRSFHLPGARPFSQKRTEIFDRARLHFGKTQLQNIPSSSDITPRTVSPDLEIKTPPSWRRESPHCPLLSEYGKTSSSIEGEEDSARSAFSIQMGERRMVPTILVNDVRVI